MAGTAVVGALKVLLSMDTAEFNTAARTISDTTKAWTREWKSLGQQATQLGSTMTKAITLPLLGLGAGVAKLAIDFESSFSGIGKTVDGVADSSGKLTKSFPRCVVPEVLP